MILYHATPGINGEKIIDTRIIKNNCPRLWNGEAHHSDGNVVDLSSSDGYVYLSNKLSLAAFYGNANRLNVDGDCNDYYIFRINIPDDRLLPDEDELRINWGRSNVETAKESLAICCCACVDFLLKADEYNIEYIHIDVYDFSSELNKKVFELCQDFKNEMKPDPQERIVEINEIAHWKKL